jgi:hypothetical protein
VSGRHVQAALPWPGLPFFTSLSVISLLISKHLV